MVADLPQPTYFSVWHFFRCRSRLTARFGQFILQVIQTLINEDDFPGTGQTGSQTSLSLSPLPTQVSQEILLEVVLTNLQKLPGWAEEVLDFLSGLCLTPTFITHVRDCHPVCCLWVLMGGLSVIKSYMAALRHVQLSLELCNPCPSFHSCTQRSCSVASKVFIS